MPSIQYSVFKIATCWRAISVYSLVKRGVKKGGQFSTSIRLRDIAMPNDFLSYEMGHYRWKIHLEDLQNSVQARDICRVYDDQDLYKQRYEKVFYEKKMKRHISFIRLFRNISTVLQHPLMKIAVKKPVRQIELIFLKKGADCWLH